MGTTVFARRKRSNPVGLRDAEGGVPYKVDKIKAQNQNNKPPLLPRKLDSKGINPFGGVLGAGAPISLS